MTTKLRKLRLLLKIGEIPLGHLLLKEFLNATLDQNIQLMKIEKKQSKILKQNICATRMIF